MPRARALLATALLALTACGGSQPLPPSGCGSCADGGEAPAPQPDATLDSPTPDLAVIEAEPSPDLAPDRGAPLEPDATAAGDSADVGSESPDAARGLLVVTPGAHEFMAVLGGADSFSFTATNEGSGPLAGVSVTVAGDDFRLVENLCWGLDALQAQASCTFKVQFRAASFFSSGTVTVGAGGQTTTAKLTGFGMQSHLIIQPVVQTFAAQVGSMSPPATFTVVVIGGSGAIVTSLTGANAGDFLMTSNGCSGAPPPDATCQVQVAFRPQSIGMKGAQLVVAAAAGATVVAALDGTATP